MSAAASLIQTWCCKLDDKFFRNFRYAEPPKREWVVAKFPIKGGTVIRSAMQTDCFSRPVTWSTVEGVTKA